MILADLSVWIDSLSRHGNATNRKLDAVLGVEPVAKPAFDFGRRCCKQFVLTRRFNPAYQKLLTSLAVVELIAFG